MTKKKLYSRDQKANNLKLKKSKKQIFFKTCINAELGIQPLHYSYIYIYICKYYVNKRTHISHWHFVGFFTKAFKWQGLTPVSKHDLHGFPSLEAVIHELIGRQHLAPKALKLTALV